MTDTHKDSQEQPMADCVLERLASLEATILHLVKHVDVTRLQEQIARLQEQMIAIKQTVDTFISLKNYHNDILECRTTDTEKTMAALRVQIAMIDVLMKDIDDIVKRVTALEQAMSVSNARMALIGAIGGAVMVAVINIIVNVLQK